MAFSVGLPATYSQNAHQITFFRNIHGLIFVVDSSDRYQIDEAAEELDQILNEDDFRDAPILVMAKKQDLREAMSAADITEKHGLNKIRAHKWHVQETSVFAVETLIDGFEWLMNVIDQTFDED